MYCNTDDFSFWLWKCLISDAARTKDNSPHKVNGLSLEVTLFAEEEQSLVLNAEQPESDDEASITIVVSGDLPSEDALLNYFENARRSGGGEVLNMDYNDEGDVAITFAEVEGRGRMDWETKYQF